MYFQNSKWRKPQPQEHAKNEALDVVLGEYLYPTYQLMADFKANNPFDDPLDALEHLQHVQDQFTLACNLKSTCYHFYKWSVHYDAPLLPIFDPSMPSSSSCPADPIPPCPTRSRYTFTTSAYVVQYGF